MAIDLSKLFVVGISSRALFARPRPAHRRDAQDVRIAEGISRSEAARNRRCFVHLQGRIKGIGGPACHAWYF